MATYFLPRGTTIVAEQDALLRKSFTDRNAASGIILFSPISRAKLNELQERHEEGYTIDGDETEVTYLALDCQDCQSQRL